MKSALGSSRPPGTGFFKKSKKRSETRFGPLLMSSGRLVLFSGDFEHFFLAARSTLLRDERRYAMLQRRCQSACERHRAALNQAQVPSKVAGIAQASAKQPWMELDVRKAN